jgi:hypothetical protein
MPLKMKRQGTQKRSTALTKNKGLRAKALAKQRRMRQQRTQQSRTNIGN